MFTRLSNPFDNRFDNRLYLVNGAKVDIYTDMLAIYLSNGEFCDTLHETCTSQLIFVAVTLQVRTDLVWRMSSAAGTIISVLIMSGTAMVTVTVRMVLMNTTVVSSIHWSGYLPNLKSLSPLTTKI